MKNRNPIAVFLLPFVTFGIYSLVWQVKTKGELNSQGAKIPTAWLIIVPLVSIWWYWKYSEGVEQITNKQMSAVMSFVLLFLLGFIGQAIIQDSFNKVVSAPGSQAPAPATTDTPTETPTTPASPAPTA